MAPPIAHRANRRSGVVVPHEPTLLQRVGAWLVFAGLRLLTSTMRFEWGGCAKILENPPAGPMIFCVWHNRLGVCMKAYGKLKRVHPRLGLAALVSASRDGGFLAAILECFGVRPVRGSSSRRGPQALLELTSGAEQGLDLAITPDGPRGPCYQVQEGVMAMAQLTGLPIVPFSCHIPWKVELKSWDRFQIPLPFTRCIMRAGEPLLVPREVSGDRREELRQQLERTLVALSAESTAGRP